MGGVGAGHAKLLLFGEHAAVFGHPALGLSLPQTLTARLEGERVPSWDLAGILPEDRAPVGAVLGRLEALLPGLAAAGRCRVTIDSDVARGVGFGSSAALCAALARAALEHAAGPRGDAWRLAHESERLFHGTPSGIDTGLSLLGGLLAFQPSLPGLPAYERLPSPRLWLVTAAVPRDEACGALIRSLGDRMRAADPFARDAIAALGRIAQSAWDALRSVGTRRGPSEGSPDPAVLLGGLADAAMEVLRGLGLGTPGLDALLAAGTRAGARGGKLSGAGGGGAFYLVAGSISSAETAADAVTAEAARGHIRLSSPARVIPMPAQPSRA